jgi:hypothetical protein
MDINITEVVLTAVLVVFGMKGWSYLAARAAMASRPEPTTPGPKKVETYAIVKDAAKRLKCGRPECGRVSGTYVLYTDGDIWCLPCHNTFDDPPEKPMACYQCGKPSVKISYSGQPVCEDCRPKGKPRRAE